METDPRLLMVNFTRVPHWRWLQAQSLIDQNANPDPKVDDAWVLDARNAISGCAAGPKISAINEALAVWRDGSLERRWELEARLLTDESLEQIARKGELTVDVVEAFAELFFAVRARRKATDWLMRRAVEYNPITGFTGPLPGALWKYVALTDGTAALELVIAVTTDRPLPRAWSPTFQAKERSQSTFSGNACCSTLN